MREYVIENREHLKKMGPLIRQGLDAGLEGGKKLLLVLQRPRRNSLTNAKQHAMMTDLWYQAVLISPGRGVELKTYSFDECKALLVIWFAKECELIGEPLKKPVSTVIDPMSGERISIRPSTAGFSQTEACKFVEFLYSIGADSGVVWSEKAKSVYEEYARAQ